MVVHKSRHEGERLAGRDFELRHAPTPIVHPDGATLRQGETEGQAIFGREEDPGLGLGDAVARPGVVEGWLALESHPLGAADPCDPPDDARRVMALRAGLRALQGHEVLEKHDTVRTGEVRHEDVGVGVVELPGDAFSDAVYPKPSAFGVVQDGVEYARGVEVGQATPVDGAVGAHECHGVQVSDDPVVVYRFVRHFSSGKPPSNAGSPIRPRPCSPRPRFRRG